MKIEQYKNQHSTHYLKCKHCIGKNKYNYLMKCLILKTVKSGKLKIIVFGNRYWKGYADLKRIRYVRIDRLIKLKKDLKE